jgi:hypothetical protein
MKQPVGHQRDVAVVGRRRRADEDRHRHGRAEGASSATANAANKGIAAGKISGTINLGATGTPLQVVARNPGAGQVEIVDLLVRLGQVLDEQNIPETGRWVVMPAWAPR